MVTMGLCNAPTLKEAQKKSPSLVLASFLTGRRGYVVLNPTLQRVFVRFLK